ncbi:hypothetical protein VW040_01060 [Phaeobacter sp. JH85H1]|uniref:hypothetical protein n=1 Tax=unclassified Phaeobacter TaxID=2621772 RepID=UPI003A87282B
MKRTLFGIIFGAVAAVAIAAPVNAYTINGHYASQISCEYGWSAVRGESGYTGVYEVLGEYFSVYFGSSYCPY